MQAVREGHSRTCFQDPSSQMDFLLHFTFTESDVREKVRPGQPWDPRPEKLDS